MSCRSGARIIKAAIGLAILLAVGTGCDLNPPEPSGGGGPQVLASPVVLGASPSPTARPPGVWVVAVLGLNVHQEPALTAAVIGTAAQGSELDLKQTRTVGNQTWLDIAAADGSISGWVLDQPDLVIHQPVNLHIDSDQSWSMLFPSAWAVQQPGAPTGTTTLSGGGISMTVDVEAAAPKFTPPGSDQQDQQVEVYGKTTVLSTYRLQDGSYELVARAKWDATPPVRFFTITYHEPAAAQPDSSLCQQLIASIKIT